MTAAALTYIKNFLQKSLRTAYQRRIKQEARWGKGFWLDFGPSMGHFLQIIFYIWRNWNKNLYLSGPSSRQSENSLTS